MLLTGKMMAMKFGIFSKVKNEKLPLIKLFTIFTSLFNIKNIEQGKYLHKTKRDT